MARDGPGRKARCLIPVVLTAGLAACATEQRTFPPPSAEIREELYASQVVMGGSASTARPHEPNSGVGAGAAEGALGGAAVGATPIVLCHPDLIIATLGLSCMIGLPVAAVTTPVGALVGAGVGAGVAHPEEEVEAASASLITALAEANLTEDLFEHLRAAGAGHRVATLAQAEDTADPVSPHEGSDAIPPDTVLEIGVSHVRFDSSGEWDPDLSIRISARAHLVRGPDGRVAYRRAWEYRSPWRGYFDMAEDDARLLRTMIDIGLGQLAEAIATDLFVDVDPEIHAAGPVPVGEVWTTLAQTPPPVVAVPERAAVAEVPRHMIEDVSPARETPAVEQFAPPVPPPPADAGAIPTADEYFGAIAIASTSNFRSGACVDQPTAAMARACAIRDCGARCEIRTVFGSGQCAAIAGTDGRRRPEDIAVGPSSWAARDAALSMCRAHPRMGRYHHQCEIMARPSCNLPPGTAARAPAARSGPAAAPERRALPARVTDPDSAEHGPAGSQHFGAIAVSRTSTFRSGVCVNATTAEAAVSCALRECGGHCQVHVAFGAGQCAMIAGKRPFQGVRRDSPHNRWRLGDAGVGASPTAARHSAMAECRRDNRNCAALVQPVCNG